MRAWFSSVRGRLVVFATAALGAVVAVAVASVVFSNWTRAGDARIAASVSAGLRGSYSALERLMALQASLQHLLRLKDADEIEAALGRYQAMERETNAQVVALSAAFKAPMKGLQDAGQAVIDQVITGNAAGALELYVDGYSPRFAACAQALRRHADEVERGAAADMQQRERENRNMMNLAAGILAATLLMLVAGAWRFQRAISRPLANTAGQLEDAADALSQFAEQVSRASQNLADGASSQAASLEETSASLEEISSMTARNADSAERAKNSSQRARRAADTGTADMKALTAAMDSIKEASANVGKIVKTIDEIAFQTNILALNAAVEAARAGEAGAGFAVVADEVRALAQRSAQAARESADKIADSISRGEAGAVLSEKVAGGLTEIHAATQEVDDLIGEIATSSREQSTGFTQVVEAVAQIDKITQANAAAAEENAGVNAEMLREVGVLHDSVHALRSLLGGAAHAASSLPADHAAPSAAQSPESPQAGQATKSESVAKSQPALQATRPHA